MTYIKFFNCETLEKLNASLTSGIVTENDLVFISGTKQIWTKGTTYNCPYTAEEVTKMIDASKESVTNLINEIKNTTATSSSDGLMSASDKAKLDSLDKITVDSELSSTSTNPVQNKIIYTALDGKSDSDHTHSYAGSSSVGGSATSAVKLDSSAGSTTKPVYFSGGKPVAIGYTIESNVPANAVFTDTTYSEATASKAGLMSAEDKATLDGLVSTGGEANQNAFSNVKVGSTTIAADSVTDTLTIAAGSNITITPDATNDKITIAATDTTYNEATDSVAGLMSADDKAKLDGIETGAQVNTVTGVKGNSESSYRTGNINITAANIGLGNVTNESKTTMFSSAALTGTPTAPTAASGTNTTQIATTAFVQSAIDTKIAAADAMIYKGTVDAASDLPSTTAKTGWTYKVTTAGTYADQECEVGDMIICLTDGSSSTAATWSVVQNNIDGAVTGPTSSVNAHVAVFDGTTGKVIKDSGYTIAKSVPSNAVFTDTDTKVTTVGNHYTPTGGTTTSASGGALTDIANSSSGVQVVTGVTKDAAGHVTGVTSVALKSTNTTYDEASSSAAGLMSASDKAKLDGIDEGANAYTLPNATSSVLGGVKVGNNITVSSGTISLSKTNVTNALGYTPPTSDTTYSAGTGLSLSGTTFSNSGVRSIATGATNGTISVNTGGTSKEVAVYGLGTAAYTDSTAYATSGHTHSYAGSATVGGSATSAVKLDTATAGSATLPCYFVDGKPTACNTSLAVSITGSAASVANSMTLTIAGGTTEGTSKYTFNGSAAKSLNIVAGSNITLTTASGKLTIAATDTTYSAGTGISLSGTTFSNSGVRSIATGTANGTISVNTGGTTANVAVYGLKSAAYTESSAYATASHSHDYVTSFNSKTGALTSAYTATTTSSTTGSYTIGKLTIAGTDYTLYGKDTNSTYEVATTSADGLMSSTDKSKLDAIGSIVTSTKTLTVSTSWLDTGITTSDLGSSGTYVVQVFMSNSSSAGAYSGYWSGIMSAYYGTTNSTASDEIVLHCNSQANGAQIYLRTLRQSGSSAYTKIQISASVAIASTSYTFKFRKLI